MDKQTIYQHLKQILDLSSIDLLKLDKLGMEVWSNASYEDLVEQHGLNEELAEKLVLTLELLKRIDDEERSGTSKAE